MTTTALPRATAGRKLSAVAVLLAGTFAGGCLVLGSTSPAAAPDPDQVRVGRAPAADDEIVLDVSTALARRIRLGDTVDVQGTRPGTFRVVGLTRSGRSDEVPDSLLTFALGGVLVLAGLVVVRSPRGQGRR